MPKDYNRNKIFEILEKLPEEVKEVLFSEKTADYIDSVCKKYSVPSDKISEVAKLVGQVLLGILSLEELPSALEKEVGLKKSSAKSAAQEIELTIFSQIKESLNKPAVLAKKKLTAAEEIVKEELPPRPSSTKDTYREKIE